MHWNNSHYYFWHLPRQQVFPQYFYKTKNHTLHLFYSMLSLLYYHSLTNRNTLNLGHSLPCSLSLSYAKHPWQNILSHRLHRLFQACHNTVLLFFLLLLLKNLQVHPMADSLFYLFLTAHTNYTFCHLHPLMCTFSY